MEGMVCGPSFPPSVSGLMNARPAEFARVKACQGERRRIRFGHRPLHRFEEDSCASWCGLARW